jgi:hypothetical protein
MFGQPENAPVMFRVGDVVSAEHLVISNPASIRRHKIEYPAIEGRILASYLGTFRFYANGDFRIVTHPVVVVEDHENGPLEIIADQYDWTLIYRK